MDYPCLQEIGTRLVLRHPDFWAGSPEFFAYLDQALSVVDNQFYSLIPLGEELIAIDPPDADAKHRPRPNSAFELIARHSHRWFGSPHRFVPCQGATFRAYCIE